MNSPSHFHYRTPAERGARQDDANTLMNCGHICAGLRHKQVDADEGSINFKGNVQGRDWFTRVCMTLSCCQSLSAGWWEGNPSTLLSSQFTMKSTLISTQETERAEPKEDAYEIIGHEEETEAKEEITFVFRRTFQFSMKWDFLFQSPRDNLLLTRRWTRSDFGRRTSFHCKW